MNLTTTRAAQTACAEPDIASSGLPDNQRRTQVLYQRQPEPRATARARDAQPPQSDSERLGQILLGIGLEISVV